MNNRKLGNSFEAELCDTLFDYGFWAHNMAQNQAGQPADVIAVRNRVAHLIDCKVCSSRGFPLSRIEENQDSAMDLWKDCGNGEGWFAMKVDESIYMIPLVLLRVWSEHHTSLSIADIKELGIPLWKWIEKCK